MALLVYRNIFIPDPPAMRLIVLTGCVQVGVLGYTLMCKIQECTSSYQTCIDAGRCLQERQVVCQDAVDDIYSIGKMGLAAATLIFSAIYDTR